MTASEDARGGRPGEGRREPPALPLVEHGPAREVYFEQAAVPGREAAFDFTDAGELGVTLRGVRFPHLLFEWVLSYSRWTYNMWGWR